MGNPIPPAFALTIPNFIPIPTIPQLAAWSGRPEASYSTFANTALFRAALKFTVVTEYSLPDWNNLVPADQAMATIGILAYADNIFLAQPYQQANASPFQSENIGSYSYSKAQGMGGSFSRLVAPAMELKLEATGIDEFDWAVRYLAKRTRTAGVFSGGITVFEDGSIRYDGTELFIDDETGRVILFGPQDHDRLDFPAMLDVNAEIFPMDPS